MGILLEQEVGVIGWFGADVSGHVIEQKGGGALCSAPMCLMELNLNYRSSIFLT